MTEGRTIPRLDSRGLDFGNLACISEEEIQAFRHSYLAEDGNRQSGFAGAALEYRETTRENFLLARAWGVPLEQALQTIEIAAVYGTEKISSAYAAIGDLIDDVA